MPAKDGVEDSDADSIASSDFNVDDDVKTNNFDQVFEEGTLKTVGDDLKTLVFQPGATGLTVKWPKGEVIDVDAGRALQRGVRCGWILRSIDGRPSSELLLAVKSASDTSYMLTFDVSQEIVADGSPRNASAAATQITCGSDTSREETEESFGVAEEEPHEKVAGYLADALDSDDHVTAAELRSPEDAESDVEMLFGVDEDAPCTPEASGLERGRTIVVTRDAAKYSQECLACEIDPRSGSDLIHGASGVIDGIEPTGNIVRATFEYLGTMRVPVRAIIGFEQWLPRGSRARITLENGCVGMDFELLTGRVCRVDPGGQADRHGVRIGWMIREIGGEPYKWQHMRQALEGDRSFEIVLEVCQLDRPLQAFMEYFDAGFILGDLPALDGYELRFDRFSQQEVLWHKATGCKVWHAVLDVSEGASAVFTLFLYKDPRGFSSIVNAPSAAEMRVALHEDRLEFGQGIYGTRRAPHEFGTRDHILWNNHAAQLGEDPSCRERLGDSDEYVVPVLIRQADAHDVHGRWHPGMQHDRTSRRLLRWQDSWSAQLQDDEEVVRSAAAKMVHMQELRAHALERKLGGDHHYALVAKSILAGFFRQRGDVETAVQLQQAVLQAREKALGRNHPDTLAIKVNLAEALRQQKDLVAAEKLGREVLQAREAALGKDHRDTLATKLNLAQTIYDRGDMEGAEKLEREVLQAKERILGADHPDTLTMKSNLAETLRGCGNLAGAEELQRDVLGASEAKLGRNHPDTLTTRHNLAITLRDRGDLAAAELLQREVLEAQAAALGKDHPSVLTTTGQLAETLRLRGELAAAEKLDQAVLRSQTITLGSDHHDTLRTKSHMALTRRKQGDLASAERLEREVIWALEETLGKDHSDTLAAKSSLVETLQQRGDLKGAGKVQKEILRLQESTLGRDHAHTLATKGNLATTLRRKGDLAGAEELQREVLRAQEASVDKYHRSLLTTKLNLAHTLYDRGDLVGAEGLEREVLEAQEASLGQDHPDTLLTKHNLAFTVRDRGDILGSKLLLREVLKVREVKLGMDHPETQCTRAALQALMSKEDTR